MAKKRDSEDRRHQRLRQLGTNNPRCVTCEESDPLVLELHHIAGRKHSDELAIVCANCHRKLSDQQRDHARPELAKSSVQTRVVGFYLLGLADLLALVVIALRKFGGLLLGKSRKSGVA